MKRFFNALVSGLERVIVMLLILMCVTIFVATVSRFTGLFIIPWAEELARYCMIWIVFIGISIAAAKGEHFCVEALQLVLPKKGLKLISILNAVLLAAFSIFVSYNVFFVIRNQFRGWQITPSLRWPMWVMYIAVPLGLLFMAFFYAYRIFSVKDRGESMPEKVEEGVE